MLIKRYTHRRYKVELRKFRNGYHIYEYFRDERGNWEKYSTERVGYDLAQASRIVKQAVQEIVDDGWENGWRIYTKH